MSTQKLPREEVHNLEMEAMIKLIDQIKEKAVEQAKKVRKDLDWKQVAIEDAVNKQLSIALLAMMALVSTPLGAAPLTEVQSQEFKVWLATVAALVTEQYGEPFAKSVTDESSATIHNMKKHFDKGLSPQDAISAELVG